MDLRFVSSNPGKRREATAAFRPYGIRIRPIGRALPEPQADDLTTVVRAKAAALPANGTWTLVEDSGLFLTALGGFPGVYSAYAYRTIGLAGLLRLLQGRDRAAEFRTVAAIRRGRRCLTFEGRAVGRIASRPRGTGGFGFDPIFIPEGGRRSFAELTAQDKLAISHRGRAFRQVAEFLTAR